MYVYISFFTSFMSLCVCDSGSICHICMGVHRGQKKMLEPPRTGVTEGWGASDGCLEPNLDPLEEQQMLSNIEPSFQLYNI